MSHLSISVLGPLDFRMEGQVAVSFGYDKIRALLAFLVVEADRPHRREQLTGMLWPDRPEPRARQSLSQAIYDLRHAINDDQSDPPFLLVAHDTIQFDPLGDYSLDVARFLALTDPATHQADLDGAVQDHEQALALYRGPFLEGFTLPDGPGFEEWATIHRERYQRLALRTCARLVQIYVARDDPQGGLRHARRQLEMDPWREIAHQQVMQLLALTGRRSEALAHFETCRRILAEELGVDPASETLRLHELIVREHVEQWKSSAADAKDSGNQIE